MSDAELIFDALGEVWKLSGSEESYPLEIDRGNGKQVARQFERVARWLETQPDYLWLNSDN